MLSRFTSRLLWLVFAAVIVLMIPKVRDVLDEQFAGVGTMEVDPSGRDDAVVLAWKGKIDAPMAARIRQAYDKYKDRTRRFVLVLNSNGGAIDHGAQVIRLLNSIAETHELETSVASGRRCASMCVPVYLAGEMRTAESAARFMFHEVSFSEFYSDGRLEVPASATQSATDRFFERYLSVGDVNLDWLAQVRSDIKSGGEVWKTAGELVAENSGIVQELSW